MIVPQQNHQSPIDHHSKRLRILFVPFEFLDWKHGGLWQYSIHFGWEEGLRRPHGSQYEHDVWTLPGVYEIPSSYPASWLYHVQTLFASGFAGDGISAESGAETFDQAFIMLRHHQIDERFWTWLGEHVPVRVGIVPESLHTEHLDVIEAREQAEQAMQYCTHICCMDEGDAEYYRARGYRTMFCPWSIPARFVENAEPVSFPEQYPITGFAGMPYGKRQAFFTDPRLAQSLVLMPRVEQAFGDAFQFPAMYNEMQQTVHALLHGGMTPTLKDVVDHSALLRRLRQNVFRAYIHHVRQWQSTIILPANFRGYSNRIVECAGAGIPVVSWRPHSVFHRPLTDALFTHGKDILLFDDGEPSDVIPIVAELLDYMRTHTDERIAMTHALIDTVRTHHTMERRVADIQRWIATDELPWYARR